MGELNEQQRMRARLRVGTLLNGKWRLDALLGVGGMAVVYSATHRNRKRAAVKVLHPEYSASPDMRARFLREGYVANSVGHPAVVSIDDDDVAEDGSAFLVMELLEGETIEERRERKGGRLPAIEVLGIADQLLDVLAVAHANGVVHRDLKPENLFLTAKGVLKVLDFGIARLREMTAPISATRTGSLMGTPAFMAPEQAKGRWDEVDGRTDLWAVGASMFDLLTGRVVNEAETANEALALAITRPPPSLTSVAPESEPALAALVDRALAYDKSQRFQSAREMQEAVWAVHSELTGQSAAGGDRAGTGQSAAGGDRAGTGQSAAGGDRAGTGQSAAGGDRARTGQSAPWRGGRAGTGTGGWASH
jgi:serine/threonine-protein kinase